MATFSGGSQPLFISILITASVTLVYNCVFELSEVIHSDTYLIMFLNVLKQP